MRVGLAVRVGVVYLLPSHAAGWVRRIPMGPHKLATYQRRTQCHALEPATTTTTAATTVQRASFPHFARSKSNHDGSNAASVVADTRLEAAATTTTPTPIAGSSATEDDGVFSLRLGDLLALIPGAQEWQRQKTATPASDRAENGNQPWIARLSLATVACLYGTNYASVKFVGGLLETSDLLALRFGLASLVLLPSLRGASIEVLRAGAEVGVYATLGYWSQAWAMRTLPASQLALMVSLAALAVPLFDQLSGRRKASRTTIFAAVLACGGAALLQSGGADIGGGENATIWDHILSVLQPIFFGLSTWRMEAHATRYPGQAPALTAGQVVVVGASSALWAGFGGHFSSAVPEALSNPMSNPWPLAVIVWMGLVTTALVIYMETISLESVSASEASVIYSLDPLVGAGIASTALGEPFGPGTTLGASLVLGGCLLSSLGRKNEESNRQE